MLFLDFVVIFFCSNEGVFIFKKEESERIYRQVFHPDLATLKMRFEQERKKVVMASEE